MESSDASKAAEAKKTVATKTSGYSAGGRSRRLRENRGGTRSASRPPKITKEAVRDVFKEFHQLKQEWDSGKSPPPKPVKKENLDVLGLKKEEASWDRDWTMSEAGELVKEKAGASKYSDSDSSNSVLDSSTGDSFLTCTDDDSESKNEAGSVVNTTFTIVKKTEDSDNATYVDDAMELSDSINEELAVVTAHLNSVLEKYARNNNDDTSNESLGECSMEDSVGSGLLNEPPPEFVDSTADTKDFVADDDQQEVVQVDDSADVGAQVTHELDKEESSDMEEDKESRIAEEEKIGDSWFDKKIRDNPFNNKENQLSCSLAAKIKSRQLSELSNQLGEECQQDMHPGPNADLNKKESEETKEKSDYTQQPTGDAAGPSTRHVKCLPVPVAKWSKSQDSKSSSSAKSRSMVTFSSVDFMIPAMSTSTPINKSKSASSKSEGRRGTPRPPKLIKSRAPETLRLEMPANTKSKFTDVKSKISTHWAVGSTPKTPSALKVSEKNKNTEKKVNRELPQKKPSDIIKSVAVLEEEKPVMNLSTSDKDSLQKVSEEKNVIDLEQLLPSEVKEERPSTWEAENSDAPAEAGKPAALKSTVVQEQLIREEANCAQIVVYTKEGVESVTPEGDTKEEEPLRTIDKVVLGVMAVGVLAVVSYVFISK